jgi:hypothetical protein
MKNNKREKVWNERYVFGDEQSDAIVRDMAKKLGRSELFSVLLITGAIAVPKKRSDFCTSRRLIFTIRICLEIWKRQLTEFFWRLREKKKYVYTVTTT